MSTSAVVTSQDMPPSALLATLKRAQERIQILEQENNHLRQEIRWIDKLLAVPASIMSPSHKVTLRAAIKAYLSGTPDEQGLVSIESWKVCKMAGQSKDTFLKNLTYCAEQLGILRKQVERPGLSAGDFSATLSIGITEQVAHPEKYAVATPRQHGGLREVCPHCHSDRLKKQVIVVCQACGAIISEHTSDINFDATGNLPMENNRETQGQVADEHPEPEPTTPLVSADNDVYLPPHHSDDQKRVPDRQDRGLQPNQADLMTTAARLLVEIAGPALVHIEMSSRGPKKYYDVPRPLEVQDACAHLQGRKTKGGWIRHPDGLTRALAYDADTEERWEELKTAARFLTYGEYIALLEPSPVGRGGHLWVLYSDLVKARDAQRHVCQYAPMLGKVKEYWPGSPNKVRLPDGKYIKPGFAERCKLYDAHGKLLASNGVEVAQALLTFQNPAEMVPEYPPDPEPSPVKGPGGSTSMPVAPAGDIPNIENQPCTRQENSAQQAQPRVDQRWQEQYGRYLWFQFTPAQLAEWYNARHAVQDILPPARNGMGLASWRGERTASVGYTKDGEGWVDFGTSSERPDGKRDGGDALELATRITKESKPEVMRQAARTLISEAKDSLESAARAGQPPSVWVQAFMSPAGWKHFEQLCLEYGHQFPPSDGAEAPSGMPQTQPVAFDTVSAQASDMTGTTPSCQDVYSLGESTIIGSTAPCQGQEPVATLAAEIGAEMGEPCHQCGCTLYFRSGPFVMCHWCYPRPRKFGSLSDAQRERLRTLFSPVRMQKRIEQQAGHLWSL